MSQPPAYAPAHEFLTDEGQNPAFPGSELDIELAAIQAVFAQYRTNLALIQRDDGALKNGVVTTDSLDDVLAAAFGDLDSIAEVQAMVDAVAADLVLTHADVVLTHADVVLTHADVISSAASAAAAALSAAAIPGVSGTPVANHLTSWASATQLKDAGAITSHGIGIGGTTGQVAWTAALTDGQLLVGQTGADPLPKTITGDVTFTAAGAAAIGAGKVTLAMIASAAYASAATASLLALRDASANLLANNHLNGYTTTATAGGTTALTVASTQAQYFTGTLAQTLVLPVTSTLALNFTYRVVNNSTGVVTVQSSGANNILILAGNTEAEFVCTLTSGTTAASWDVRTRYAGIPQTSKSTAYTTVLSDGNGHIYHPSTDNNARTFTIDSNANVPYPINTFIVFVNEINTVTISITSDTLTLQGAGTTGSRTLAANGCACALKVAATKWIISGTGLT